MKEKSKVQVALKLLKPGEKPPSGYKGINGHCIFDLNMYLTGKATFVSEGHLTDPPQSITYSNVVYGVSVIIIPTISALNYLDVHFSTFIMHTSIMRQMKKCNFILVWSLDSI